MAAALSSKRAYWVVAMCGILVFSGCKGVLDAPGQPVQAREQSSAPQKPDAGVWVVSDRIVSKIDGRTTEHIATGGPGSQVAVFFENGKLASGSSVVPVYVSSPCIVEGSSSETDYRRRVRYRFDSEKPVTEYWGITDDRRAIYPLSKARFVSDLKKHRSFVLEFGCDRSDSDEVSYDIHGLSEAVTRAGLH